MTFSAGGRPQVLHRFPQPRHGQEEGRTGGTGDAIGVVPVPDPDRVGAVERFSSSLESDGGLLRASTPDASGSANELSSSVGVSSSSHINERE